MDEEADRYSPESSNPSIHKDQIENMGRRSPEPLHILDTSKTLNEFVIYLTSTRKLATGSRFKYVRLARHFLDGNKPITKDTVTKFMNRDNHDHNGKVQMLLALLRDFSHRPDLTEGLQFDIARFKVQRVVSREQVQGFYQCIEDDEVKALFLTLASSGLRLCEVLSLRLCDFDNETLQITPVLAHETQRTKKAFLSFINREALPLFLKLCEGKKPEDRIFSYDREYYGRRFREISKKSNIRIAPKMLRSFFTEQMSDLGMQDRYIDYLQGRTPISILGRNYSDFGTNKMRSRYEKARLTILSEPPRAQEASKDESETPNQISPKSSESSYVEDELGRMHKREP